MSSWITELCGCVRYQLLARLILYQSSVWQISSGKCIQFASMHFLFCFLSYICSVFLQFLYSMCFLCRPVITCIRILLRT